MKKLPLAVKNKILKKQKDRYNLLLIHKNPSADSLKIIGPRDLGIYLKDDKLYCKINNKEEIEIIPFKNTIDTTAGIDPDVFFRLKSSLEENVAPNVADKMELVEDTYRMGYSLPEYKFNIQLSPYDHCLSEEEAEEQLLSYDTPLTPYNKKKYFEGEAKFINFYIKKG